MVSNKHWVALTQLCRLWLLVCLVCCFLNGFCILSVNYSFFWSCSLYFFYIHSESPDKESHPNTIHSKSIFSCWFIRSVNIECRCWEIEVGFRLCQCSGEWTQDNNRQLLPLWWFHCARERRHSPCVCCNRSFGLVAAWQCGRRPRCEVWREKTCQLFSAVKRKSSQHSKTFTSEVFVYFIHGAWYVLLHTLQIYKKTH